MKMDKATEGLNVKWRERDVTLKKRNLLDVRRGKADKLKGQNRKGLAREGFAVERRTPFLFFFEGGF